MVHGNSFLHVVASLLLLGLSGATKKDTAGKNNSGVKPVGQCGTWVKEPDGGVFTSPNYPSKYPPETECVYILEAPPRQCIDLHFEENYSIESSWECKFDNIEVRDGPFGFSPVMGRYCGQHSPPDIRSSGRYLWIKFVTDGELEAVGFSARYNFTAGYYFVYDSGFSWRRGDWCTLSHPCIFTLKNIKSAGNLLTSGELLGQQRCHLSPFASTTDKGGAVLRLGRCCYTLFPPGGRSLAASQSTRLYLSTTKSPQARRALAQ
ncbi:unnamed protein product [Gadus morhua 'NCC']